MIDLLQPSPQLLPAVWKLMRLRWQITINSFKHAKKKTKIWTIIAILGLLIFAGFIFWLSWLLLDFLRSPKLFEYAGIDARPFLQTVPVLIFAALFLGIMLTSFGVLLQALYLSGDMDFLLTSPVPIRAVFITKLLQAVLPNFGLVALFGLPVLYGLGITGGYNPLYYPLVLITMIVLTLVAAGISSLLVMAVVRVFPARRVAEVLGFFGAILSMICSQSGNLARFSQANVDPSGEQVNGLFTMMTRFNVAWMPLNWAGRGLVDIGEGRWPSGLLLTISTLGLAAVGFWVTVVTAEHWYYSGWAGMQVITNKKKQAGGVRNGNSRPVAFVSLIEQIIPAPVRGIVQKDFMVLRRDLRQMSQLVTPLIFGVIYTFMLLRSGGQAPVGRGEAPGWFMDSFRSLMAYGNVMMSLFVGWWLLNQLAGNSISREGKNYWILKASPLHPEHLLTAKFIVAFLPALGLGWFFLIGISIIQKISLVGFLYGMLSVAMCLAGMTGILIGTGTVGARFNWEDPRKMNSGSMGCLGSILTVIFVPLAFGLFIGPLWIVAAFRLPMIYGYLAGFILGAGITLMGAILPLWLARGKIANLDEG
jgi:ABC-2 type transport system permease protein